jgi:hypothetical protein
MTWRTWLLLLVALPTALGSWLLLTLLILFGFAHRPRWAPGLLFTAAWRPWVPTRFSVTLGRAVVFTPLAYDDTAAADNRVERHEAVHVRQAEDENAKALLLGGATWLVTGNHWLALAIWCSGGLWLFLHNVTAVLRYGLANGYRDAEHERSAYAQTDLPRALGKTWEELREEARRQQAD